MNDIIIFFFFLLSLGKTRLSSFLSRKLTSIIKGDVDYNNLVYISMLLTMEVVFRHLDFDCKDRFGVEFL